MNKINMVPGRNLCRLLLLALTVAAPVMAWSQHSTLVRNYSKLEYGAGSQNWSLDMDHDGYLYVANNNGLLIFDGAHWKTLRAPNQSIIRSVYAGNDGRIYVGSFEEFGYWQHHHRQGYVYQSLKPLLKGFTLHNHEIWKIVESNEKIYFQGFSCLFVYDGKTVKNIPLPGNVLFLLKAGERLFIQVIGGPILELIGDNAVPLNESRLLSGTEVKTILPLDGGKYLFGTTAHGVFEYNGTSFYSWNNPVNEQLKRYQINNGVLCGDKIVFGTIVKGIFVLSPGGQLLHHYHGENKLKNNTVLSLCNDNDRGVWAGMDMGISNISFNHPISVYEDEHERLGAVYTAAMSGNTLYVGTNRGVFTYKFKNKDFKFTGFLENSQGQVWQLKNIDGELLCGHTNGTYRIHPGGFLKISDVSGGYDFQKILHNGKEFLLQNTYTSLVIYKKTASGWKYSHLVKGFMEPSRFMETDHLGNIWIGHSVKGLYRLRLNDELDSVISMNIYGQKDGLPTDFNIRVYKLEDRVVFLTGKKIFTWDDLQAKIIPHDNLNPKLGSFQSANSLCKVRNSNYWLISNKDIALFDILDDLATMKYRLLPGMYSIQMVDLNENIVPLNDSLSLICLDNGFAIADLKTIEKGIEDNSRLIWSELLCFDAAGNERLLNDEIKNQVLDYSFNNLSLSFSVIGNPGITRLFQYRLEGLDPGWSDWDSRTAVRYTRLPAGEYTFYIRTLSPSGKITEPLKFKIKVKPPWYSSKIAIAGYCILVLFIIGSLMRFSRRRIESRHARLRKQDLDRNLLEKQKAEQEIMLLQNQNLQTEVSHKNLQLANSTRSIIRKNEVLIEIRNELNKQKEALNTIYPARYMDKLITLIDKNISSDTDWQLFETLFDQAHENFFRRLKQSFPDLTQSDLKLCAYLKLNLSSKEIAPLLNISVRGVEIRRYRLRKRLTLPPEYNLVDYIMQY